MFMDQNLNMLNHGTITRDDVDDDDYDDEMLWDHGRMSNAWMRGFCQTSSWQYFTKVAAHAHAPCAQFTECFPDKACMALCLGWYRMRVC